MRLEALALIEGNLPAQRMIASWPLVGEGVAVDTRKGAISPPSDRLAERWAEAALVDDEDIERLSVMLVRNEIILSDGRVADEALALIRRRIAEKIRQG